VIRQAVAFVGKDEVKRIDQARLTLICPACLPAIQTAIDLAATLGRARN